MAPVEVTVPLVVNAVKVPTDVILGCAAVVIVSAVADSSEGIFVSAIIYSPMLLLLLKVL